MSIRSACLAIFLVALLPSQVNALSVDKVTKMSSFVTTGGDSSTFKRTPQKVFDVGDKIILVTMAAWEPIGSSAGRKRLKWRWYSNGKLISEVKLAPVFKSTPFEIWGSLPASALGVGNHKVELIMDEKLFDSQEFQVTAPAQ